MSTFLTRSSLIRSDLASSRVVKGTPPQRSSSRTTSTILSLLNSADDSWRTCGESTNVPSLLLPMLRYAIRIMQNGVQMLRNIVRRVVGQLRYRRDMGATKMGTRSGAHKRPLGEVLSEIPGRWAAVDRRTNELRAVASDPYALAAKIRADRITGVAVVRAPDPSEPELVGLG
jgi:hypothetical protein